jgi:uncharacterized membrane protein YbaN (DUF454 family)
VQPLLRGFWIVVGTLSTGLGLVGIFVPVLPTTPFLLLAAFCFARSSAPFYRRLMSSRWVGPYLRNYREGGGMTRRDKAITLIALWLAIGTSALWGVPSPAGRAVLLTVAGAVTFHILRIKTLAIAIPPENDAPGPVKGLVELEGE